MVRSSAGTTTHPSGRRATPASSRPTLGIVPVIPAASTGWVGGVRAQRVGQGIEQAAAAQTCVEPALLCQDRGPAHTQQLEEGQRILPMLGEIARHQLVEPVQIDFLVVQLVEEALELAGQPHRLFVRHPRTAREHEAREQEASSDRADRRRQSQLQLGVEQQQGLVRLPDRQQARQQQSLAATEAQEGVTGCEAGAARRQQQERVCKTFALPTQQHVAISVSRNGRSAAMVWTFGISAGP